MTNPGQEPSSPNSKLVLIIDDDPGVVAVFTQSVAREGFRVASAADGEEGLSMILEFKPDLVILDMMMPGYGGFEVIQMLKSGPRAATPIVVITGCIADSVTRAEIAREPNVVAFLDKPIRHVELASVLHKVLKTDRANP